MVQALVPVFFMVIGALVYALAGNAKLAELGRGAFWGGCFGICYAFAHYMTRLL